MSVLQEFKQFAVKGNVADMAVGIIIGAAFGKIVSSLVADVLMPPIGMVIGGVDFSSLKVTIKQAAENVEAVTLNYGIFLQTIIDFTIVAFAMFLLIKVINTLRDSVKNEPEPAPKIEPVLAPEVISLHNQEKLLAEIRDLLAKR